MPLRIIGLFIMTRPSEDRLFDLRAEYRHGAPEATKILGGYLTGTAEDCILLGVVHWSRLCRAAFLFLYSSYYPQLRSYLMRILPGLAHTWHMILMVSSPYT